MDEHITLSQKILAQKFPDMDGLQYPLVSHNLSFKEVEGTAMQIHNIGCHWVTSHAKEDGKVHIYDSKFSISMVQATYVELNA